MADWPKLDLFWLLDWMNEDNDKGEAESGEKPGVYERIFKGIWRDRFIHLHPDVIPLAVEAEWKQMKLNPKTGEYERTYPAVWKGSPFFSTPEGIEFMRSNR